WEDGSAGKLRLDCPDRFQSRLRIVLVVENSAEGEVVRFTVAQLVPDDPLHRLQGEQERKDAFYKATLAIGGGAVGERGRDRFRRVAGQGIGVVTAGGGDLQHKRQPQNAPLVHQASELQDVTRVGSVRKIAEVDFQADAGEPQFGTDQR